MPDAEAATAASHQYLGTYLASILEHYEVMGDHFATTKGYGADAKAAEVLRRIGESGFLEGFLRATAWGTPERVLDTLRARRELLGPFELCPSFRFGGIPYEQAEGSMRLFAAEVLPELKTWD